MYLFFICILLHLKKNIFFSFYIHQITCHLWLKALYFYTWEFYGVLQPQWLISASRAMLTMFRIRNGGSVSAVILHILSSTFQFRCSFRPFFGQCCYVRPSNLFNCLDFRQMVLTILCLKQLKMYCKIFPLRFINSF